MLFEMVINLYSSDCLNLGVVFGQFFVKELEYKQREKFVMFIFDIVVLIRIIFCLVIGFLICDEIFGLGISIFAA